MKDMFHNYDYHINEKLSLHRKEPDFFEPDRILTSDPNISIIKDVKNKEIGVKVKQGMPFTLYFYLDDYSTAERISDIPELCNLVLSSNVKLEVVGNDHKVIFEVIQPASDIFNLETSELIVNVNQDFVNLLDKDSYRIRLRLVNNEGYFYEVYSEADGLLIVR